MLNEAYRPTRDIDLMGYGDNAPQRIVSVLQEICAISVEPDGIDFDSSCINVEEMRGVAEFQGLRVHLRARLGTARVDVRIDIGFGDAIFPQAVAMAFPTILDFPQPILKAYSVETIVAEKFEALVALGYTNSRM